MDVMRGMACEVQLTNPMHCPTGHNRVCAYWLYLGCASDEMEHEPEAMKQHERDNETERNLDNSSGAVCC
jgi:hypothetical protein